MFFFDYVNKLIIIESKKKKKKTKKKQKKKEIKLYFCSPDVLIRFFAAKQYNNITGLFMFFSNNCAVWALIKLKFLFRMLPIEIIFNFEVRKSKYYEKTRSWFVFSILSGTLIYWLQMRFLKTVLSLKLSSYFFLFYRSLY